MVNTFLFLEGYKVNIYIILILLEDKYENYCGEDVVSWLVEKVDYYNKLFGDMLKRSIPHKEETGTSLFTNCYYGKEEIGEDCVKGHDHLNVVFRSYVHNRCNLPAKNTIKPLYALN